MSNTSPATQFDTDANQKSPRTADRDKGFWEEAGPILKRFSEICMVIFEAGLVTPLGAQQIITAPTKFALAKAGSDQTVATYQKIIDQEIPDYIAIGATCGFITLIPKLLRIAEKLNPSIRNASAQSNNQRTSNHSNAAPKEAQNPSNSVFNTMKNGTFHTIRLLSRFAKTAGYLRLMAEYCVIYRLLPTNLGQKFLKLDNSLFVLSLFISTLITLQCQAKPALWRWLQQRKISAD